MRSFVLIGSVMILVGCVSTQPVTYIDFPQGVYPEQTSPKLKEKFNIDYKKYKLSNGLTVILHKDTSDPLVHVDLTYHVGSAREEIGKSGFAHFFEHMMFQGSRHVRNQEHFKYITEAGGTLNGTTNQDRTNYYQTVPANELEKVLWLESDRMGYLLDAVSQQKFEIQRDTVKNERAQNYDNRPYGLVSETLSAALYPASHPYSWPTIGYVQDLDKVGVDDLKDFFLRWYGPNNATLTIGGDINYTRTLAWVEKYFGDIPAAPEVQHAPKRPVKLASDRFVTLEDNIKQPLLVMSWPTLYPGTKQTYALDILASLLGNGRNSLLYQAFVKSGKALVADANQICGELACHFQISVLGKENQDLTPIRAEIMAIIEGLTEKAITAQDLAQIKGMAEANAVFSLESVQGKVSQLAANQTFYKTPDRLDHWWQSINAITAKDVDKALMSFIKTKPSVSLSVVPKNNKWLEAQKQNYTIKRALPKTDIPTSPKMAKRITSTRFDRTIAPAPFGSVSIKVPQLYETQLENGMTLVGTQATENDTIVLHFVLPAGSVNEPEKLHGIAELTAQMLMEGTQTHTSEEIEAKLDRLGSTINVSAGRYGTTLSISSLTKNFDATLLIAADILLHPRFDEEDFKRIKQQALEKVAFTRLSPTWKASQARREVLYQDLWYGLPTEGVFATIKELNLSDVRDFYQRNYTPQQTTLIAVGNITQADLLKEIAPFSQWKGELALAPAKPSFRNLSEQTIWLVDKPDAPQSVVQFVRHGLPYSSIGEMFKIRLANFNLAGNFNSRLNQNLREDKGYTYGASGSIFGDKNTGEIVFQAQVRADSTLAAINEIRYELDLAAASGFSEKELEFMRLAVGQSEALSYETPNAKANLIALIKRFDLPDDYKDKQNQLIETIKKSELDALAKKWFKPQDYQIIVVGDAKTLTPQLQTLGLPVKALVIDI